VQRLFSVTDGTAENRLTFFMLTTTGYLAFVATTSNNLQASIVDTVLSSGVTKIAIGYATDDYIFYKNGLSLGTDTSGTVPACSQVNVGVAETGLVGTGNFHGWIRSVALFPTRLSNAQLASLTTL
jgi:hypothetical protein